MPAKPVPLALVPIALIVALASCSSEAARGAPDAGEPISTGGTSGDGSTSRGGAAADAHPFDTSGGPTDPIPTLPREWVWVPFPDAKCRDGSTAGIEVSSNPASDELVIYLEGGGSCWNLAECAQNPALFAPPPSFSMGGIFDRANSANPVKDWNMVYVPYCTGDYHAGNNPGFDPGQGIGPQQFVGYTNIEKFLGRLVPTFPNVKKILHTGFSAGGVGALLTVDLVAKKFPSSAEVILVDDSAPPASTAFLPPCLQRKKRTTWGFDKTFLVDCGADCPDPDDYYLAYAKHLAKSHPARRMGLIEAEMDLRIRVAFGYTASDCNQDVTQQPAPADPAVLKSVLLEFRKEMAGLVPDGGASNFGTFYVPGSAQHGWLTIGDSLYTGSAGSEKLIDWFTGIVNGSAPTNIGL